jgi:hypothetical protein
MAKKTKKSKARRGAALDGRPYHPATGAPQRPDATADGVGTCTGPIAVIKPRSHPLEMGVTLRQTASGACRSLVISAAARRPRCGLKARRALCGGHNALDRNVPRKKNVTCG